MLSFWWLFLFCPLAYLLGTVNFSILISRFKGSDVRKSGSGNPGATNMLRAFGFKWAMATLLLDMLKGGLPTLVGLFAFGGWGYTANPFEPVSNDAGQIGMYACGLAVAVGHCFPVFMKFRGGKGVATIVGVFTVINPLIGLAGLLFGMLYWKVFEYVSISSFSFLTIVTIWEGFVRTTPSYAVASLIISYYLLVLFTHRGNVYRLLAGKERRAKNRSKKAVA